MSFFFFSENYQVTFFICQQNVRVDEPQAALQCVENHGVKFSAGIKFGLVGILQKVLGFVDGKFQREGNGQKFFSVGIVLDGFGRSIFGGNELIKIRTGNACHLGKFRNVERLLTALQNVSDVLADLRAVGKFILVLRDEIGEVIIRFSFGDGANLIENFRSAFFCLPSKSRSDFS